MKGVRISRAVCARTGVGRYSLEFRREILLLGVDN